jgi:hypothetical protein
MNINGPGPELFFFVGWNKQQPPFAAAESGNTKPQVSWLYMKGHQWGYANQKDGDLKIRSIVIYLGFCLWTKHRKKRQLPNTQKGRIIQTLLLDPSSILPQRKV